MAAFGAITPKPPPSTNAAKSTVSSTSTTTSREQSSAAKKQKQDYDASSTSIKQSTRTAAAAAAAATTAAEAEKKQAASKAPPKAKLSPLEKLRAKSAKAAASREGPLSQEPVMTMPAIPAWARETTKAAPSSIKPKPAPAAAFEPAATIPKPNKPAEPQPKARATSAASTSASKGKVSAIEKLRAKATKAAAARETLAHLSDPTQPSVYAKRGLPSRNPPPVKKRGILPQPRVAASTCTCVPPRGLCKQHELTTRLPLVE